MKKTLALLLALCMIFALAACGQQAQSSGTATPSEPVQEDTAPTETEVTEAEPAETDDGLLKQPDGFKGNVTFIVSSDAGSSTDTAARALLEFVDLGEGVNVVVENVPGGSQTIGTTEMLNRPADGYTMVMMAPAGLISQPLINDALTYSLDDIQLLCNLYPYVTTCVITAPDSDLKTPDDFYNFITSGEPFQYANANIGGFAHVAFSKAMMQIDNLENAEPVAYKGSASLIQAVLNHEVPFALIDADYVVNYVKNGEVTALMIFNDSRFDLLPDLPCSKEYGFDDLASVVGFKWLGMRQDIPEDIAAWIEQQFCLGLASPEYQAYLDSIGAGSMVIQGSDEVTALAHQCRDIFHDVLLASGYITE